MDEEISEKESIQEDIFLRCNGRNEVKNNFNEQKLQTRNVKLISVFNFRESYKNVSFLYFSDDMDWARKNLKDKHHDLVITFVKMIKL